MQWGHGNHQEVDCWGRVFSPMVLGPVPLYNGMVSRTMEAAWQFSKVYTERAIQYCERHQAPRGPACRTDGCKGFSPRCWKAQTYAD